MNWKNLLRRVWSWLLPCSGWRERVQAYRSGVSVWPIPDRPDMDPLFPWPSEWCLWEAVDPEDPEQKSKSRFLSCTSLVSGRPADGDDAVRCSRCGIPLHMSEANMASNIEVPACSWCIGAVRRTR